MLKITKMLSVLLAMAMAMPAAAQWVETHKLTGGAARKRTDYGVPVGIAGNTAILGANADGPGALPVPPDVNVWPHHLPPPYYDTSDTPDNYLSPLDALVIINYLNE